MAEETTRSRLLEQASQLIREDGYQQIPLRKLTALLGVTTGAFYKAFKDKEELYYQLYLLEGQRQADRLQTLYLDKVTDPLDGIWHIGYFLLSEYEKNANMMYFLFFSPVSVKAYRQGVLLAVADKTLAYIKALGVDDKEEQKQLLLKLEVFIMGYGRLISKGLEVFDEGFYQSTFNDFLGGYKHV